MESSKYKLTILPLLAILAFGTFAPTLAFAAPVANSDKDWQNVNGNTWAWNYSPQDQINKNNVQNLEVKWLFPLGAKSLAPTAIQTLNLAEGTTTPPLVVNGKVYVVTNWNRMYAVDAKSGKQLWTNDYSVDLKDIQNRLPWASAAGILHFHGFNYWAKGNALLAYGLACDFYGIDATTGKQSFWVKDLCKDVPGNLYNYRPTQSASATIGAYDKGNQFIVVQNGYIHSSLSGPNARHVTMGIDQTTKQIVWRVFSSPPQGVQTKDWALQECSIGYFQTHPCSDVAAKNQAGLEWDWGLANQPPNQYAGATANWGQMIVDEDTGILYTQTGNQGPYSNMSLVPGPRLYGSTIMAIDMNKGARAWWLQPFPHDPYDYDCNWSGMLIDSKALGKVYVKGCKEGIIYVMDAATGKPKYTVDVLDEMVARGQIGQLNGPMYKYYRPDPYSLHDMREWNWISYPATKPGEKGEHFTLPAIIVPSFYNGLFATDMSYDPQTDTIYHFASAAPISINKENPYVEGGNLFITSFLGNSNATVVARDLATGKEKWNWFYQYSQPRAAMVVSGGMVFTGFTDGFMRFFDKDNGKILKEINLGSADVIAPTIGKDSDGNSKIFTIIGATRLGGVIQFGLQGQDTVPGTILALGLSSTTAPTTQTTTVTTTQVSTSSTTLTSATTQTQTQTQTVTTSVTSQVTQTTGLPAEITYAVAAVAVIAIIAAAFLAMRKK